MERPGYVLKLEIDLSLLFQNSYTRYTGVNTNVFEWNRRDPFPGCALPPHPNVEVFLRRVESDGMSLQTIERGPGRVNVGSTRWIKIRQKDTVR